MSKNFLSFAERSVSGEVESRPYAEMRNFKVTKRRRQYRAYGRFHHDR